MCIRDRPPVTLTIELDETLASLAVDHRDGGLLATESLDLMEGREREGETATADGTASVSAMQDDWFLGFTVFYFFRLPAHIVPFPGANAHIRRRHGAMRLRREGMW